MHRGFGTLGKYALLGAYIIFCNSLLEEYVWRWFVFRRCEDLLAGWLAVLASGLFFTLHHAVLLAVEFDWKVATLSSAGVFAGGAIWSFHYLRYRSVWPGYLSHAIVDVTILAIGYHILFQ
jgi:membrane protease YdiL (CAAX protease family)